MVSRLFVRFLIGVCRRRTFHGACKWEIRMRNLLKMFKECKTREITSRRKRFRKYVNNIDFYTSIPVPMKNLLGGLPILGTAINFYSSDQWPSVWVKTLSAPVPIISIIYSSRYYRGPFATFKIKMRCTLAKRPTKRLFVEKPHKKPCLKNPLSPFDSFCKKMKSIEMNEADMLGFTNEIRCHRQ